MYIYIYIYNTVRFYTIVTDKLLYAFSTFLTTFLTNKPILFRLLTY